jgi:hypothetical protein
MTWRTVRFAIPLFVALGGPAPARADDAASCAASSDEGQDLRDRGAYRKARVAFATCARDACPALIHRDCLRWLSELEEIAPTVVVSARDPDGNDLVAVRVILDGEVLQESADGKPVLVDAGAHTFRFESSRFGPVEKHVVLRAGEKARILDVRFASTPAAREREAPASDGPRRSVPTLSWILGGVALVAFGSEAYFGVTGLSARSDARAQPCAPACPSSDADRVRTKFIVADVSLGVGVLALAGALYVWATSK